MHIGDVALVYMGRGPNVTQMYDSFESERAADMVNRAGVCILIDLIGYTSDHRQDVLALRPAPLQMHYHGYMGSTGAAYIDYYMGDRVIVPPEHARHAFTEALVLLPESFLGPSHRLSPPPSFLLPPFFLPPSSSQPVSRFSRFSQPKFKTQTRKALCDHLCPAPCSLSFSLSLSLSLSLYVCVCGAPCFPTSLLLALT